MTLDKLNFTLLSVKNKLNQYKIRSKTVAKEIGQYGMGKLLFIVYWLNRSSMSYYAVSLEKNIG